MSATMSTVPPVLCTLWCTDGTGHPDAEEPADQFCHGIGHRIDLASTAPHLGGRARGHLIVQLYRDVFPAQRPARTAVLEQPHIEVYSSASEDLTLSTSEARALGDLLIELAKSGEIA